MVDDGVRVVEFFGREGVLMFSCGLGMVLAGQSVNYVVVIDFS
jgi:hypothetical protein